MKAEWKDLLALKRNKDLTIKGGGKGYCLVLMNKLYSKKKKKKNGFSIFKWCKHLPKLIMESYNSWCVSYNPVDVLPVFTVTFKLRKIAWDPDIFYFSTSYLG